MNEIITSNMELQVDYKSNFMRFIESISINLEDLAKEKEL
jgi:hypothetical protein